MKRLLVLFALVPTVACAELRMGEEVPVKRLIKNVEASLKSKPADADQLFLLARLHSMAYALKKPAPPVYFKKWRDSASEFRFAPWVAIQLKVEVAEATLSAPRLQHLRTSYLNYQKVVALNPESSLPKLGWGWVSEEAAQYPAQTGNFGAPRNMTAEQFTEQAIKLYREVVAKYRPNAGYRWDWPAEEPAYEAAKNLQRLVKGKAVYARIALMLERALLAKIIAEYEARPIVISPVIFPRIPSPVTRLVDPTRTTTFDIAADGIPRHWPWVAPQAAFLAWDPAGTGVIKDGTQLFGNRTFNMFFRDGYAALASLDNNHDGWLTGIEIRGIVVWNDRNQNGASDRGEITPVERWGVTAIRTKSNGSAGGMLAASTGIRFLSGQTVPTYDWLPTSKTGALKR
jgi:hypothetical protein